MAICATWRARSWNSVHTMNSSTPIPWDSFNNAFTQFIKFGFIIPYHDNHKYTYYYWFYSWEDYSFSSSYKYQLKLL